MNERWKAGLRLTCPPSERRPLSFLLQVALETLLLSGPQKPLTHPLADYHYAGTGARLREWVCPASTREPVSLDSRLCLCPWAYSWGPPCPAFPEGSFLPGGPQWVPLSPGWVLPSPFQCSGSLRGCAQPGKGSPGQGEVKAGSDAVAEHPSLGVRQLGVPTSRWQVC